MKLPRLILMAILSIGVHQNIQAQVLGGDFRDCLRDAEAWFYRHTDDTRSEAQEDARIYCQAGQPVSCLDESRNIIDSRTGLNRNKVGAEAARYCSAGGTSYCLDKTQRDLARYMSSEDATFRAMDNCIEYGGYQPQPPTKPQPPKPQPPKPQPPKPQPPKPQPPKPQPPKPQPPKPQPPQPVESVVRLPMNYVGTTAKEFAHQVPSDGEIMVVSASAGSNNTQIHSVTLIGVDGSRIPVALSGTIGDGNGSAPGTIHARLNPPVRATQLIVVASARSVNSNFGITIRIRK